MQTRASLRWSQRHLRDHWMIIPQSKDTLIIQRIRSDRTRTAQYFLIHFPEPLEPEAQLTLSISYYYLSSLTPLPASIKQEDRQYLTYSFSAYIPSAYKTLKQKTKLKFPSSDVPEYTTTTGLVSSTDPEVKGSTFTYGPYDTSKIP